MSEAVGREEAKVSVRNEDPGRHLGAEETVGSRAPALSQFL